MAKSRVVNTFFWDDEFIVDLDPIEKLVFLYVLTNPLTDICGAYEITLKRIAFDTGIERERIIEVFQKFETAGKIIYRDSWLLIRNFAKHQATNPSVELGRIRSLSLCPDWIRAVLGEPVESLPQPVGNSDSNSDSDSDLNLDLSDARGARGTHKKEQKQAAKKRSHGIECATCGGRGHIFPNGASLEGVYPCPDCAEQGEIECTTKH